MLILVPIKTSHLHQLKHFKKVSFNVTYVGYIIFNIIDILF